MSRTSKELKVIKSNLNEHFYLLLENIGSVPINTETTTLFFEEPFNSLPFIHLGFKGTADENRIDITSPIWVCVFECW